MLWRLGQLLERDSQSVKAKAYYRLALKHSRADTKRVQLYYDSLERRHDLYVPLKTYYDLVEYRKNLNTFHPPKGVYTSMGDAINSKAPDYGPALAGNDSLIIFSSKRKRRGPDRRGGRGPVHLAPRRRELERCRAAAQAHQLAQQRGLGLPEQGRANHLLRPLRVRLPATATATSTPPRAAKTASGAPPKAWAPW